MMITSDIIPGYYYRVSTSLGEDIVRAVAHDEERGQITVVRFTVLGPRLGRLNRGQFLAREIPGGLRRAAIELIERQP